MRLIFVNYSHPGVRHVAGTRLWSFGRSLARRGHRVVLISTTLPGEAPSFEPADMARVLDSHDWREPLHVTCASSPNRLLALARSGRLPSPLRRAISLWSLTMADGPLDDWVTGSRPLWPALAEHFRPDLVWANFGSISDLALGRGLAHRAGCQWVADVKDNVRRFIPRGVRPLLALRFADAAGVTANARFHGELGRDLFDRSFETIYSGVDSALLERANEPVSRDEFRISLVGSVYSPGVLADYFEGVRRFLESLPPEQRSRVRFCYAGGDEELVRQADAKLGIDIDFLGYLPVDRLFECYQACAVNTYIWPGTTFHHKAVEMMAANRPLVSFPGEFEETGRIAARVGAELLTPGTSGDLAETLSGFHRRWREGGLLHGSANCAEFTWDAQAEKLERVFENVLRARPIAITQPQRQT